VARNQKRDERRKIASWCTKQKAQLTKARKARRGNRETSTASQMNNFLRLHHKFRLFLSIRELQDLILDYFVFELYEGFLFV
jgi:hypothetical protein